MISGFIRKVISRARNTLVIKDKFDVVMLIITSGLLTYTIIMAFVSDITYDEAWTYMHYALRDSPGFLDVELANNHPLNSFFIYLILLYEVKF